MKKNLLIQASIILLSGLVLITGSCRKKQDLPQETPVSQAPVKDTSQSGPIQLNRTGNTPEQAPQDVKENSRAGRELPDLPEFSGPLFLQRELPQSRILPEGNYIGPFLDYFSTSENERLAGNVLQNFFFSFFEGIVDDRYLVRDTNRLFRQELDSYKSLGREMRGFTAGSLKLSGNRGSVRIRIFSDTGSITGRIYLFSNGNSWYLEDWEIPFVLWPGDSPAEEESDGS